MPSLLSFSWEYTECQAFSPVVRIGSPPHPQASVATSPLWFRGGHTRLRKRGRGEPIQTKGQTLWCSSIIPLRMAPPGHGTALVSVVAGCFSAVSELFNRVRQMMFFSQKVWWDYKKEKIRLELGQHWSCLPPDFAESGFNREVFLIEKCAEFCIISRLFFMVWEPFKIYTPACTVFWQLATDCNCQYLTRIQIYLRTVLRFTIIGTENQFRNIFPMAQWKGASQSLCWPVQVTVQDDKASSWDWLKDDYYIWPVFRICGILRRIQILGSAHWITDPGDSDPDRFVGGFQDANKKLFFSSDYYFL